MLRKCISPIPFTILNTALGLMFYLIGLHFRKLQYKRNAFIAAALVFATITLLCPSFIGFRDDSVTKGYWVVGIIYATAGIIIFNNLLRLKFLQFPVLTSIGRESMNYYCSHWILFYLVIISAGINGKNINGYSELSLLVISSIIVLPCYSYWYSSINSKGWRCLYDYSKVV